MQPLLTDALSPLVCPSCGDATGCAPAIVVWTDRRSGAEWFDGGPWIDGPPVDAHAPEWSAINIRRHDDLASLRTALDDRYCQALTHAVSALTQDRPPATEWFHTHYLSVGAEAYAAALLAARGAFSVRLETPSGALSEDDIR